MENNKQNIQSNRPSWDKYFMQMVDLIGSRGTCDRGHVGCVITREKRIVSSGYAGSPAGLQHCDEVGHEMHTIIHEDGHESRHCIRTTHAEQNAICQAARFGVSLKDATLYCKMTPCYTCAKMIINAGITRVVCDQDYHAGARSKEIFEQAGIKFELLNNQVLTYKDQNAAAPVAQTVKPAVNEPTPIVNVNIEELKRQAQVANQLAQVFVYDEFNPEDNAMLQALYSRSPSSVTEHVNKVRQSGSGKFMETFYVGYGHASIADCGSTTVFIEKISTLADKAVQDWPLYSGQETSTRYVDMSKQPIVDPVNSIESKQILDAWMTFYISNQEAVQKHIAEQFPKKPDEDEKVYIKAVKARTFDIMRGFLPAGITTQLSWHTNLRQAWDKLAVMRHHPLTEVRDIAENILEQLKGKYSHSFGHQPELSQEHYRELTAQKFNYYSPEKPTRGFNCASTIAPEDLTPYQEIIDKRPLKTGLPQFLAELGTITFDFMLDFGSFRDIQRHRNGVCRMPLVTTKYGFNQWYLEQLPPIVRTQADNLIAAQTQKIAQLGVSPEIKQYYVSLGFNLPCRVTYGLPAACYVIELRSGKAVHPTLRQVAHQMHHALAAKLPNLILHSDLAKDEWDVRRGLQDIIKKV
jgi:deoxycytidylate deaminase/thymidylate synthase ThyX